jgi:hypothetical protein
MSDWVDVAAVEDFPVGGVLSVEVDGAQVAVVNVDGTCYAIEDICPHDGSILTAVWWKATWLPVRATVRGFASGRGRRWSRRLMRMWWCFRRGSRRASFRRVTCGGIEGALM